MIRHAAPARAATGDSEETDPGDAVEPIAPPSFLAPVVNTQSDVRRALEQQVAEGNLTPDEVEPMMKKILPLVEAVFAEDKGMVLSGRDPSLERAEASVAAREGKTPKGAVPVVRSSADIKEEPPNVASVAVAVNAPVTRGTDQTEDPNQARKLDAALGRKTLVAGGRGAGSGFPDSSDVARAKLVAQTKQSPAGDTRMDEVVARLVAASRRSARAKTTAKAMEYSSSRAPQWISWAEPVVRAASAAGRSVDWRGTAFGWIGWFLCFKICILFVRLYREYTVPIAPIRPRERSIRREARGGSR
jgi:hypothetical protein